MLLRQEVSKMKQATIYCDGGCRPNPGSGGWGAVILYGNPSVKHPHTRELAGGEEDTTNNRMELRAAIEGLRALKGPYQVEIVTDSKYLKNGVTLWMSKWMRNGWKTAMKEPVKNSDLWQELQHQISRHEIQWKWTKGHAGNKWNELADKLASGAIKGGLPLNDHRAIHIFLAGSVQPIVRTGTWAAVLKYQEHEKTLTGALENATSNSTILQGAIETLTAVKQPKPIHVYTNSEYLHKGATAWMPEWRRAEWQTRNGEEPKHLDLWHRLAELCGRYVVTWYQVEPKKEPEELQKAKQAARRAVIA